MIRRALTGRAFPYRTNSLNMFRLVLAILVLIAHSFYTTGNGVGPRLHGENIGGWAVAGFFVLSGFLITRSRLRSTPGDYLVHRVARIFPAFLVCLVVTAAVFAPLALLIQYHSLRGYLSTPVTPFEFIWSNITLFVNQYGIGRSLSSVPYPSVWNGSLWTLYYEFLCYVLVWVLGALAWFRRNAILTAVGFLLITAAHALEPIVMRLGLDASFLLFLKLAPFFLGGAVVYFLVDRWGVNGWIGIGALVVAATLCLAIPGWGGQIASPFIAYGLLWLSTVIPQPAWIARNDVSYGFYIYAWPVQQLLALVGLGVGAGALGLIGYDLVAMAVTFVLAWLSWVLVERRVMARVRGVSPRPVLASSTHGTPLPERRAESIGHS
ncbi:acyltransferase [uncultured Microbacterium sp.]|uniref:acyltransferase family protein n=1 Tax=uncultured Microbacterium sp. TaxID=191216 RepID=UPI0025CC3C6F|nr:acyltransferase [uncultured Microbacterium sp.]